MENKTPYTSMIINRLTKVVEKLECPLPTIPNETTSIYQSGWQECIKKVIEALKTYER